MTEMKYSRKNKHSVHRLIAAVRFSIEGIICVIKTQPAFRELAVVFAIGQVAVMFLSLQNAERAILSLVLFLPILTEIINCAIENLADAISREKNQYLKNAKDCGSAATFVANIIVISIWLIILIG